MRKKKLRKRKRTQKQNEIIAVTIAVVVTLLFVSLLGIVMNLNFDKKDSAIPVEAHGRLSVQGKNIVDDTNYDYDNIQYKDIIIT